MSIIYSNAFLLAEEAAGRPMTNPRIGWQTHIRDAAITASAVTASTTDDDGAADAPLRPDTYEYWAPTALPATWAVDLGAAYDVDYVGIAGHTIGSNGAAVKVQYSTNNADWTDFSSEVSPGNDTPIMFLDTSVFARYWRIYLTGTTMPQVATVYVGEAMAMERAVAAGYSPINMSRETTLKRTLSRGGRFLGQAYRRNGVSGEAHFVGLTAAWYRSTFDPFVLSARRFPFFFSWNPEDYSTEVVFAWATSDIKPAYMGLNPYFDVSIPMQGIGYGD